jgi:hypothetical protein
VSRIDRVAKGKCLNLVTQLPQQNTTFENGALLCKGDVHAAVVGYFARGGALAVRITMTDGTLYRGSLNDVIVVNGLSVALSVTGVDKATGEFTAAIVSNVSE